MIKFMIVFDQPEDPENFENVYQDFLALVERMPHILRRQVVHITGSPQGAPRFYRILELYFESTAAQQDALMSEIGQEAGQELSRLPKGAVQLLFADVYEEEGGRTSLTTSPAKHAEEAQDTETAAQSTTE
ncbi:MAG: EthD family reductase [Chloroflexi bacterium]|nr:EthD family reductase [Chloroflexota bacterium]